MALDKLTPEFSFYHPVLSSDRIQALLADNPFMTLTDAVYYVVADEIVHFRLLPETKLAAARIAADLNVSRTPVTIALDKLASDGFVCIGDGKYYIVSPFDKEEYQSFFRLRAELEAGAIRLAAENITKAELNQLKRIHNKLSEAYDAGNWDGITNGEQHFHQLIVNASKNEYFISAYRNLYQQIRRYRIYLIFDLDNMSAIKSYHKMLVNALESGTADICEATIRAHLTRVPLTYADYEKTKDFFSIP